MFTCFTHCGVVFHLASYLSQPNENIDITGLNLGKFLQFFIGFSQLIATNERIRESKSHLKVILNL